MDRLLRRLGGNDGALPQELLALIREPTRGGGRGSAGTGQARQRAAARPASQPGARPPDGRETRPGFSPERGDQPRDDRVRASTRPRSAARRAPHLRRDLGARASTRCATSLSLERRRGLSQASPRRNPAVRPAAHRSGRTSAGRRQQPPTGPCATTPRDALPCSAPGPARSRTGLPARPPRERVVQVALGRPVPQRDHRLGAGRSASTNQPPAPSGSSTSPRTPGRRTRPRQSSDCPSRHHRSGSRSAGQLPRISSAGRHPNDSTEAAGRAAPDGGGPAPAATALVPSRAARSR